MQRLLVSESKRAAGIFIFSVLTQALFMCCFTLNKLPLCLCPDKNCLGGNRDSGSPAHSRFSCTSLAWEKMKQYQPISTCEKDEDQP